ncbi:MAG: ComEC family competence protein [Candidatus Omnitrophica bacterium]|nr:ComEC family competence protein [Candidatus Omnitrophota bacterium]
MKPKQDKTHRPLLWVTVCFGGGILLGSHVPVPVPIAYGLAVICIILSFLSFHKPRGFFVFLFISFVFLGVVHLRTCKILPSQHISQIARFYYGAPVLLEGVVVSDVEQRQRGNASRREPAGCKTTFRLEVKRLKGKSGWQKSRGEVLVDLFRGENIFYGDYLAIEGKLHKPFDFFADNKFSYRDYLDRKGIKYILSVKKQGRVEILGKNRAGPFKWYVIRFKHRLNAILADHFTGVEKGIMEGFLLGDRYNIPQHINELFQKAGVVHILAISGFNVGIVAYVIFLFLKIFPLGRRGHYILTILILIVYAVLTGGQPPVVRATIMAVVFLAGFILEREPESINTLSCAALLILFLNPSNLFDVGFQLSFVSVLAIIVFYPKCASVFARFDGKTSSKNKAVAAGMSVLRYIGQSFVLSFCAYGGVAVMVAYYFEFVTPVAILANLVVIPLSSLIVVLGLGVLLTGLALPAVTFLFADCIRVLLALMVKFVFWCVQIPGAYFRVASFPAWVMIVYYLFIMGILWLLRRKRHTDRHLAEKTILFS